MSQATSRRSRVTGLRFKKINIWRVRTKSQNEEHNLLGVRLHSGLLTVSFHSDLLAVSFYLLVTAVLSIFLFVLFRFRFYI